MRPKGTTVQHEARRRVASSWLEVAWGVRHMARRVHASPLLTGGSALPGRHMQQRGSLPPRGGSQLQRRLTHRQPLVDLLNPETRTPGVRPARWPLARVAPLIMRPCGVADCPQEWGISGGAWIGAPYSPRSGRVNAMKTLSPRGPSAWRNKNRSADARGKG
jgi:hypothetical protein